MTEKLEPGAKAEGQRIADLSLPSDCLVMAVVRGDEMLVPRGETVLQSGDEVLALVRREAGRALHALLTNPAIPRG